MTLDTDNEVEFTQLLSAGDEFNDASPEEIAGYIALHKFGYGGTCALYDTVQKNPKNWLREQIARQPIPPEVKDIGTSDENYLRGHAYRQALHDGIVPNPYPSPGSVFSGHVNKYINAAIATDTPFAERLVHFWANHFTVTVSAGAVASTSYVPYVNETIRPHVFGTFENMLKAATTHLSMLNYLNNRASKVSHRDGAVVEQINENHARELLELHTVGVRGGYTQEDIIQLAFAMTGWTIDIDSGKGYFRSQWHADERYKPFVTLMGNRYPNKAGEDGRYQLLRILRDLANHPNTYKFLAYKLLRHFWKSNPAIGAGNPFYNEDHTVVTRLAKVLERTGGDLAAAAHFLVNLPYMWDRRFRKYKTPIEYYISMFRTLGIEAPPVYQQGILRVLSTLGQQPFNAVSPEGWPDKNASWMNSNNILKAVKFANAITRYMRTQPALDLRAVREDLLYQLNPGMTRHKWQIVEEANGDVQAVTLLLGSPGFFWR